ncbi:MAG TPA: UDP-N-acetylmuramoyl-L-alanyl-D-glutamate--2,6-diaminopimelate ligase [Candidatus Saccharimonadales bacterium]|nr:UDP-N-acetylmuramoyl-L-alanyl-D-glutamate--2,6-diaminopimelate ligase [Candidatus Saccharimonadales bacterium]
MNLRSLVKAFIPKGLFRRIEPYGHLAEAFIYNLINGFPARRIKVIGVTGTNGKTSTSFLIHRMMSEAGYKTGLMTTVGWGTGKDVNPQIHHMTNVAIPELMQRLKQMKKAGTKWLVLETTSHALAQNRVWGIPISVAVMTNITHEHLEYHGTFERYREAKLKLFKLANRNKKGLRAGVINADDPSAGLFAAAIANPLTYGLKSGDLRASGVKMAADGSSFKAKIGTTNYALRTNLPSGFNVYNSLAAASVGHIIGLSKQQIEQGIAALESVEGRMNTIDEGQPFTVIVDYAHTPDSFEKMFKELRPVVKGKIIVMFGSAGRRDTAKRPIQGELAGKYCDEVVLTEEDDRDEDGNKILEAIAKGAQKAGKIRDKDLFLVLDRPTAIKFALGRAKAGDTVLLLGKGHEKTIERDDREDPYDEVKIARESLKNLR